MSYVFNVFTGTLDNTADNIAEYSTFSAFPSAAVDGTVALALDTKTLYVYDVGTTSWKAIAKPGDALSVGTYDSSSAVAAGLQINSSSAIIAQSATTSFPGMVNTTTQSFAGNKTFTGTVLASNLSGTNTGDQTITLTGDVSGSGTGSFATTLATVNPDSGTFGTASFIPSYTVNNKGLITASTSNLVVAPAGTLSGTTLNSTVVSSSLTSVGVIASGTWQGTAINLSSYASGTLQAAQFPALTGDVTTTAGSLATTLATVNGNVGTFGANVAIPVFTVNAKGLITGVSNSNIVAPAGSLSGTTLNSTVVSSSLTSVGVIASGTWQGTVVAPAYGGTGSNAVPTNGQIPIGNGTTYTAATITAGTGITVTNASGSITISSADSSSTDIAPTNFNAANNVSSPADVTGLSFSNASVRGFQAFVTVYVNATSSLYEAFELQGIQKGSSWDMSATSNGDVSGFTFTVTTAGQIQYTDSNYTGFTAATVKFRATTLPV